MKKTVSTTIAIRIVVVFGLLFGMAGCDHMVAGELATLSGAYVGDVVTSVVTGGLHALLGLAISDSSDEHADEHEHEDDSGGLHDHDH